MNNAPERIGELSAQEKRSLLGRLLQTKAAAPERVPLSYAQERLWFLDRFQPGLAVYNIATSVPMPGAVDVAALEQSLNEVVRRHASLRTTFRAVEGRPVQVVAESGKVALPVIDLRDMPAATRGAEAQRLAVREAQRPFDLARGPLFRASLLRVEGAAFLLLTMHHIVSDGWSLSVLLRELTLLYEAYSAGRPSPLPELPLQYADYARWQRHWLQGEVLERHLAYWRRQLSGAPAVLELPTDRPRPAVQTFNGAWQNFPVGAPLRDALQALSRRLGVTLYMTLLAAFQTLLHRYSNQADMVVGTPIANRTRAEHEGLIGFFANTLVLRTDLGGNPRFAELMGRVREATLGAYAHQDLPFEKLVEELQPARHLSHHPLFQVMFAYQNVPQSPGAAPAFSSGPVPGTAKFDLSLFMEERGGELQGTFEYNTDLFDHDRIARMVGHFQTVLAAIAAAPEQRLWELPLLTEAERQWLLAASTAATADFAGGPALHELFEAQAAERPEAVAVMSAGTSCSYGALNRRANRLAHHLRAIGVGPDVRVGLCVERSLDMVVGLLGILKAGGAYVPLDPAYPPERLSFMLADAEIAVLVSQERLATLLPFPGIRRVSLDADAPLIERESDANPGSAVLPDNLAYVIYTSGSTGKPKGVQISHSAVVNFLQAMARAPGLAPEDRLLAVTTLSFDIAALEILLPLSVGACVVVARREECMDGASLAASLSTSAATVMQATPVTWQLLVAAGWQGSERLKMFCGGEALSRELADRLLARGASLWNLYGPTETTIWSTAGKVAAGDAPVAIGRAIANAESYVLDAYLNPVPVGVAGELYIGGSGLARGYVNRPAITAERFVPHPFARTPGERLYRTGDVARYRADGSLELLGRTDTQMKIRGFRIEAGEIETVLEQHPDVRGAVVVARPAATSSAAPQGDAGKRLIAYVVPRPLRAPAAATLYDFLKRKLPDYMLPSAFVPLAAFPVTPAGKIDRHALPEPDGERPALREDFVKPRDPVEAVVAGIWTDVLGLKSVGMDDNFFDLGGHSLLATQVMSRLSEALQQDLPVLLLFEAPTVAELSGRLCKNPSIGARVERAARLLLSIAAMSDEQVTASLHLADGAAR